jgi:hypothetical protein
MGQSGVLPFTDGVSEKIESILSEENIQLIKGRTPEILQKTNEAIKSGKRVAGIFHTTC